MTAQCPECDSPIEIEEPAVGEILDCAECGIELEVIAIDPLEFAIISEEEMDDDWDDDVDIDDDLDDDAEPVDDTAGAHEDEDEEEE